MPYKKQLQEIFHDSPGIVERVDVPNSILINLKEKGFHKLVENCLKNKSSYSSVPFLFEVFIANWLLQDGSIQNIEYEPEDYSDRIDRHDETRRRKKALPDFTFSIEDKNFVISLKTITQVSNEETRRKITAEIKKRKDGIPNIQIWLSPEIEDGDINEIVNWVVKEAKNLSINEKAPFLKNTGDTEPLATIKKLSQNQGVMVEIIGSGPNNGLLPPVDSQGIKDKIKNVTKKAYKCFPNDNDGAYNFIFLTTDSYVFFVEHELKEALWGTTELIQHEGCNQLRCQRKPDGILRKDFSRLDAVFFFPPKTDFLKKNFNPQVVINPQKIEKLQNIPEPFKSLFCPSQDLNEFGAKL